MVVTGIESEWRGPVGSQVKFARMSDGLHIEGKGEWWTKLRSTCKQRRGG